MLDIFKNILNKKKKLTISDKDKIAALLGTNAEALEAFEKAYHKEMLNEPVSDNLFAVNAKQASDMQEHVTVEDACVSELIDRIVAELLQDTAYYTYKDGKSSSGTYHVLSPGTPVTKEEIMELPEELRPQLTGNLMIRDIKDDAYPALLGIYADYQKEKNPKKKQQLYGMFRQGLELQDLDAVMYRMLEMNQNSIGNWFPQLTEAASRHSFFQIPDTTIIKVPLTMLQLARLDYFTLTKTTLEIVDRFCEKAFHLDRDKEYFIKTGVFSSKYDFRNARVSRAEEVLTLYKTCGMPLIRDMAETAVYMKNLSKERDRLLLRLDAINQRIDSVEKGNLTEERCRKDAKDLFIKAQNAKENELVKAFLSQKYGEQMTNKIAKEIIG